MPSDDVPHISVVVGILVGLTASFIQSFGLTLQRKSHLQNEALVSSLRKSDYKRPLWIGGFLIFICSNLLGTIFQIGALPIVVLGPLGAVSLLYNAFFAKVILGDRFSIYLVAGTILIAGGATLIGIFGVVPEETHTLDELIALYSRPSFIIWICFLSLFIFGLLTLAHLTEWTLERRLQKVSAANLEPPSPGTPKSPLKLWRKRGRGYSQSKPIRSRTFSTSSVSEEPLPPLPRYGSIEQNHSSHSLVDRHLGMNRVEGGIIMDDETKIAYNTPSFESIERTKLLLGVAYGTASGILSGLCLLFAKTGVELLILTVVGQNQFGRYQAWLIVLVLLLAALAQLFYLNRALRLVGPTLMCPLAFCFYNISSIISGLIYYDQWELLSGLQFGMVTLGTFILLTGVWIVSLKVEEEDVDVTEEMDALLTEEPDAIEYGSDGDVESSFFVPRGLSIGIGSISPGFEIRPHRRVSGDLMGGESPRARRERVSLSLSGSLYTGERREEDRSTRPSLEETRVPIEPPSIWHRIWAKFLKL